MNTANEIKEQHYIPKFYLKGFTDKARALWVYEKFKPIAKSTPKLAACRPDYYTHAEQGRRDERAEDVLKVIESKAAPIICNLANPQYVLTPDNAAHVIAFAAFMFVRVPSWREYLDKLVTDMMRDKQLKLARDKEKFHQMCAEMEEHTGKPIGMDREALRQYILDGKYEIVQASTAYNLGAMFSTSLMIMDELKEFGYEVLYAPREQFFVTSDSPASTLKIDKKGLASVGFGFGWPGVEVHLPLNKRACLRLKRGAKPAAYPIHKHHVEQINELVMATATRYLYCNQNSKRIARMFNEYGCKVRLGKEAFLRRPI